jgi:hypothetical protein
MLGNVVRDMGNGGPIAGPGRGDRTRAASTARAPSMTTNAAQFAVRAGKAA